MRRIALAVVSTVASLVFLLSYKTHSAVSKPPAAIGATAGTGTGTSSTGGSSATTTPSRSSSSASAATSTAAKTYTGSSTDTQWGPVQVRITVKNGKITAVDVVDYPHNNSRDQEINSFALPQLTKETLSAQSAKIDTVSGATVTSDGYLTSLQSALDQAGL